MKYAVFLFIFVGGAAQAAVVSSAVPWTQTDYTSNTATLTLASTNFLYETINQGTPAPLTIQLPSAPATGTFQCVKDRGNNFQKYPATVTTTDSSTIDGRTSGSVLNQNAQEACFLFNAAIGGNGNWSLSHAYVGDRIFSAQVANLATLSTAYQTQPVFGPWPSLSTSAAAQLENARVLSTKGLGLVVNYGQGIWYLAGDIDSTISTSGTNTLALSTTYCHAALILQAVTIDQLADFITTASAGNHLQLALYAPGTWGRPGKLMAATASIITTSTGAVSGALTSNQHLSAAGQYWFCIQTDSTVPAFAAWVANNFGSGGVLTGSTTLANVLNASTIMSAVSASGSFGTWPDFTSATSWTDRVGAHVGPVVAFHVFSVP